MRMTCQPKLMLGVIALTLGASAPARLLAQTRTQEKLPDETPRALVVAFRSPEKGTGTNLGEQIRTKLQADIPIKQMYVIPKATICANLEASGFPCDSMPDAITSRLLATSLRADFYVDGIVTKTGTGYKSDARLVLARDNSMVQPLPSISGNKLGDIASQISKAILDVRKELPDERTCETKLGGRRRCRCDHRCARRDRRLSAVDDRPRLSRQRVAQAERPRRFRHCGCVQGHRDRSAQPSRAHHARRRVRGEAGSQPRRGSVDEADRCLSEGRAARLDGREQDRTERPGWRCQADHRRRRRFEPGRSGSRAPQVADPARHEGLRRSDGRRRTDDQGRHRLGRHARSSCARPRATRPATIRRRLRPRPRRVSRSSRTTRRSGRSTRRRSASRDSCRSRSPLRRPR